uniref:Helicase ATP-binding domain-containing protein n=1 Tax=viral metagenome TaxID=1070528 RepID=A0A6C0E6Q4_9ZZZZ
MTAGGLEGGVPRMFKNTASDALMLTHRGLAVSKTALTKAETATMRAALTVKPRATSSYAVAEPFAIYYESPTRWYVPRYWDCPEGVTDVRTEGRPLRAELQFNKTLRPEQLPIVDAFKAGNYDGLICVPCGYGKTFMAIWLACQLRRRFLIVVHQEFLMEQWRKELEGSVPGIRIGVIQQDKIQTERMEIAEPTVAEIKERLRALGLKVGESKSELLARLNVVEQVTTALTIPEIKEKLRAHDLPISETRAELLARLRAVEPAPEPPEYDCCICMLQTVAARDWPLDTFAGFGFTIFDECHHLGAAHFSRALMSIQTRHMLGLSATPERLDGLDDVFRWFIGPIRYQIKVREADDTVEVRVIKYEDADPAYADEPTDWRGEIVRSRLCNQLTEHGPRTLAITTELEPALREGRKLLVLSDRREHLKEFEAEFKKLGFTSIGYYVGGMTAEGRDEASKEQIILATFTMAAEGMNIRDLNTVLLATPKSRIEQAVGRIFRLKKEERTFAPVIYDVVDSHGCLQGQAKKRMSFYKQCGYRLMYKKEGAWAEKGKAPVAEAKPMFRS